MLCLSKNRGAKNPYLKAIDDLLFILLTLWVARVQGCGELSDKLLLKYLALSPDIKTPLHLRCDLIVTEIPHRLFKHTLALVHHLLGTFSLGVLA